MSYSSGHETSSLRSYALKGRAQSPASRIALLRCFRPAPPLPDPAFERSRREPATDSPLSGLRFPNGTQRHPRFQRTRPRCPQSRLFKTQAHPRRFRRARGRSSQGAFAPLSQGVRKRHEPLDAGACRGGEFRGRHNRRAGFWGDDPLHAQEVGSALGEGQEVDQLSRSRVRKEKGALSRPEWALGFEDETW
jgi:hypothetical protein